MRGVVMAFASWSQNAHAGKEAKALLKRISFRMKNQTLIAVRVPPSVCLNLACALTSAVAVLERVVYHCEEEAQVRRCGEHKREEGASPYAERKLVPLLLRLD